MSPVPSASSKNCTSINAFDSHPTQTTHLSEYPNRRAIGHLAFLLHPTTPIHLPPCPRLHSTFPPYQDQTTSKNITNVPMSPSKQTHILGKQDMRNCLVANVPTVSDPAGNAPWLTAAFVRTRGIAPLGVR